MEPTGGGPSSPGDSGRRTEVEGERREEFLRLYEIHVAEYRFQVDLNWKRSQYFLALNLAVLVAGGGLLGRSTASWQIVVAASVFLAGIATSVLGHRIISSQHKYYRNSRDRLRQIEAELALGERGLGTTPKMGGVHVPTGKITPMLRGTLIVLGVLHGIGAVASLVQFALERS